MYGYDDVGEPLKPRKKPGLFGEACAFCTTYNDILECITCEEYIRAHYPAQFEDEEVQIGHIVKEEGHTTHITHTTRKRGL